MRDICFIGLTALVAFTSALQCGLTRTNSDELKNILSACVKNNETLQKIWDLTSTIPTSSESESSEASTPNPDLKMNHKSKRATQQFLGSNNSEEDDSKNNTNEESVTDEGPTCIVHCVFDHLGMLDDDGYPEHGKFVDSLLKSTPGRELRDFLQDSADECFQECNEDTDKDPCTFSSKLVKCLAEKGKSNCEDWPIGNLPF